MDKTAIKNFAISARKTLKTAIAQKAYDIGVFEDKTAPVSEVQGGFIYNEQSYSKEELAGRKKLIDTINLRADSKGYKHGYTQVIEEVAYTWFNRLIALRFMELNGYLPCNVRILSSVNPDRLEPDCIREVESLDFVDVIKVSELSNDTEKLYRYILIAQCNALANIMPRMFEKIADYTELLLPDRLYLQEGNIVYDLVHGITEADFTEQVEIIGWLYQFYISEKKDEVFAGLKKNIKITKENIPAATQLFTPDWIVKYMVENSLGRLAVEKLDIDPAEMGWKYYLPEAEQTDEVMAQLAVINADKKDFDIKNVKVIDPCMGSGHILVYAFDVLYQIYEKLGYVAREIANLIIDNNLFGLDIDGRAGQLAYFALMMKARNYNRRYFRQDTIPQPKVFAIMESDSIRINEFSGSPQKADIEYLVGLFADAKEYGSILKIERTIDYKALHTAVSHYNVAGQLTLETVGFEERKAVLLNIIEIAELLTQKYDVVVTNPPYMGGSGMGAKLSEYVKKQYPDTKTDLSTVFMEVTLEMCKPNGFMAMINIPVWMFLSSYEKLRESLIANRNFVNMLHFGRGVFGADFGTTAFIIQNQNIENYKATYRKLFMKQGAVDSTEQKEKWFFDSVNQYTALKEDFARIPGMPVAYWASEQFIRNFYQGVSVGEMSDFTGSQHKTADNEKYIRYIWEVSSQSIGEGNKWCFYVKGGEFRRWFGNIDLVVDWSDTAVNFYGSNTTSNLLAERFRFKEGITYTSLTSAVNGFRYLPPIAVFDIKGPSLVNVKELYYILALFNSKVANMYFKTFNATITLQVKDVKALPIIIDVDYRRKVDALSAECVSISRTDWDSFETSWDFKGHPLI